MVKAPAQISTRSVPPRIRPCLSTGSLPLNELQNNKQKKKRVVFADDRGRPLTQVRVMSEPSDVPPLWTRAYLVGVTRGVKAEAVAMPWSPTFPQPASDYLAFRHKLDRNAVSLENVIVREAEQCLVGTVKVKNLAYDKEVVVRASSDSWTNHEDVHCIYVQQPGNPQPSSLVVLYDTFRFRLTLPPKSDTIEFCVRYKTDGTEHWDNNDGKNYAVRKRRESQSSAKHSNSLTISSSGSGSGGLDPNSREETRLTDATRVNIQTWSEFASWHHLPNDIPYW